MPDFGVRLIAHRWVLAIALYMLSLALPGLHLENGGTVDGWRLLLTAWYGFLILEMAWLSNPLFIVGVTVLMFGRHRAGAIFGIAAFVVGLLSVRSDIWIANHERIEGLGSGFYVWMAAFLVLASCLPGRVETGRAGPTDDRNGSGRQRRP